VTVRRTSITTITNEATTQIQQQSTEPPLSLTHTHTHAQNSLPWVSCPWPSVGRRLVTGQDADRVAARFFIVRIRTARTWMGTSIGTSIGSLVVREEGVKSHTCSDGLSLTCWPCHTLPLPCLGLQSEALTRMQLSFPFRVFSFRR